MEGLKFEVGGDDEGPEYEDCCAEDDYGFDFLLFCTAGEDQPEGQLGHKHACQKPCAGSECRLPLYDFKDPVKDIVDARLRQECSSNDIDKGAENDEKGEWPQDIPSELAHQCPEVAEAIKVEYNSGQNKEQWHVKVEDHPERNRISDA